MIVFAVPAVALMLIILWDVFEVVVLPRRVQRRLRPARLFGRSCWWAWTRLFGRLKNPELRENALGVFGPLLLLFLMATWALALVFSFGLLLELSCQFTHLFEGIPDGRQGAPEILCRKSGTIGRVPR